MRVDLTSMGLIALGLFLLIYVIRNKIKLKRTILRRIDNEEKD